MPGKGSEAGYTHQRIYRRTRHGDRETPADDRSRHNVRGPIRQAVVPDLHGKRSRIARNLTRSEWSRHSARGHLNRKRLFCSWLLLRRGAIGRGLRVSRLRGFTFERGVGDHPCRHAGLTGDVSAKLEVSAHVPTFGLDALECCP